MTSKVCPLCISPIFHCSVGSSQKGNLRHKTRTSVNRMGSQPYPKQGIPSMRGSGGVELIGLSSSGVLLQFPIVGAKGLSLFFNRFTSRVCVWFMATLVASSYEYPNIVPGQEALGGRWVIQ